MCGKHSQASSARHFNLILNYVLWEAPQVTTQSLTTVGKSWSETNVPDDPCTSFCSEAVWWWGGWCKTIRHSGRKVNEVRQDCHLLLSVTIMSFRKNDSNEWMKGKKKTNSKYVVIYLHIFLNSFLCQTQVQQNNNQHKKMWRYVLRLVLIVWLLTLQRRQLSWYISRVWTAGFWLWIDY